MDPSIASLYKPGISNEEEYNERFRESEKLDFATNLFPNHNLSTDNVPQEEINDLNNFLQSKPDNFSEQDIPRLKDTVVAFPAKYLTVEQVNKIFNSLPELSFSSFPDAFEMFAHITDNKDLAKIVLQHNYIQQINFEDFSSLNSETQSHISSTIINLINADDPENLKTNQTLHHFYLTFFPHFYPIVTGNDFYRSTGLAVHLRLAERFLVCCGDIEFTALFKQFALFVYRGNSFDISASLHGLCRCLSIQPDFIAELRDGYFINQLYQLSSRTCLTEDWLSKEVRSCALVVFEFIASSSAIRCDDLAYECIEQILLKNFTSDEDGIQFEAIYLFGIAVANPFFTSRYDDPHDDKLLVLVNLFLTLYENLNAQTKEEWIRSFANVIYFLKNDFICRIIQESNLFMICLEDALNMHVDDVQNRLMKALHTLLFQKPDVIDLFLSSQEANIYQAIEDLLDSEDPELQQIVQSVLSIFKQHMGEEE